MTKYFGLAISANMIKQDCTIKALVDISPEAYKHEIEESELISSYGYEETASVIKQKFGINLGVAENTLEPELCVGDSLIIAQVMNRQEEIDNCEIVFKKFLVFG
ncbi:MAG: hypothetical protein WBA93_27970 [Microcoleaceae cyanobacterium]